MPKVKLYDRYESVRAACRRRIAQSSSFANLEDSKSTVLDSIDTSAHREESKILCQGQYNLQREWMQENPEWLDALLLDGLGHSSGKIGKFSILQCDRTDIHP